MVTSILSQNFQDFIFRCPWCTVPDIRHCATNRSYAAVSVGRPSGSAFPTAEGFSSAPQPSATTAEHTTNQPLTSRGVPGEQVIEPPVKGVGLSLSGAERLLS